MESFTTWLTRHPDISAQLEGAVSGYNKAMDGNPSSVRGTPRSAFETAIRSIADTWQTALYLYKSEIVDATYTRLDAAGARRALTVQWDRLLHANGDLQFRNLAAMTANIDAFSAQFRQTQGGLPLWETFAMTSPAASPGAGFIPVIGQGFSDSYVRACPTCLAYSGETELEPSSKDDFELGMSGTGWIGLLVIAARTGLRRNTVFLVPASHMEKHITAVHDPDQGTSTPVPQFGGAGHQAGVVRLLDAGRIDLGTCNGCLPTGKSRPAHDEASGYGCIMGFAMVKAYDAIGHQWAFISTTCNVSATGRWSNPSSGVNQVIQAGDNQLPTDWAVAIWQVTKDLTGRITPGTFGTDSPLTQGGRISSAESAARAASPPPLPVAGPPGFRRRG